MAEYIEREQTISAIMRDCPELVYYNKKEAISCIESIPSADVVPVVHGRWYMRGGRACCSNCNVKSLWGSDWDGCKNHEREFVSAKSNYCPNCGAKMDSNEVE